MNSRISRATEDLTVPPADCYQPLRSPSHSMTNDRPPLTPPLRLHNRKILPSLLRPLSRTDPMVFGPPFETTDHRCSSLYSTTYSQSTKHDEATATTAAGRTSFPSDSVCAPTTDKLEPLQADVQASSTQGAPRVTTSPIFIPSEPSSPPYTRLKSPSLAAFTLPPLQNRGLSSASPKSWHRRGGPSWPANKSLGKVVAGFGAPSSASTSASSDYYYHHHQQYHQPLSPGPRDEVNRATGAPEPTAISTNPLAPTPLSLPTRPRRPHDEPLEIPDLVSPASSPTKSTPPLPSRALPRAPPVGTATPSQPDLLLAERASAAGIGVAQTTGVAAVPSPQGSISLQNLARQHREGSRDSWGSWEETEMTTATGRMFGVPFPPTPRSGTLP